ncbi:hypothetical protein [Enterococcus faecalis]|uniref:hypothetical protein n=1 Tax=Enterococcus faecalis TaxID=1351 RepID=UPI002477FC52|nr:hypothetical protein [Enterococcus faecalis]
MSEELSTPFLALGSVIRLNEGIHGAMLFFIVARAIAKNNDGKIISRYKVARIHLEMFQRKMFFQLDMMKSLK